MKISKLKFLLSLALGVSINALAVATNNCVVPNSGGSPSHFVDGSCGDYVGINHPDTCGYIYVSNGTGGYEQCTYKKGNDDSQYFPCTPIITNSGTQTMKCTVCVNGSACTPAD